MTDEAPTAAVRSINGFRREQEILTSVHRSVKLNVRFGTEGGADFDALHHPALPRVL